MISSGSFSKAEAGRSKINGGFLSTEGHGDGESDGESDGDGNGDVDDRGDEGGCSVDAIVMRSRRPISPAEPAD